MITDRVAQGIAILISMTMVGAALIARRARFRSDGGRLALIWVAIVAALVVAGRWIDSHR